MHLDYDAVVVGAGPAGSAAARDIAAAGYRTLLLEEHRTIGEPLHCSGLVTPRTIEFAHIGDDLIINRFHGGYVHSPSGQRLSLGGERTYAIAIDRVRFDRQQACRAQEAGASLCMHAKLAGIERDNGALQLGVVRGGRRERLRTRLLIGADGAQSFVGRWLDNGDGASRQDRDRVVAISADVRLPAGRSDFVEVLVGRAVAPGFFAWVIPVGEGVARVGLATNDGERPVHYLRALMDAYPAVFDGAEVQGLRGGVIPLQQRKRMHGHNVMLVGDAAGHVKPTSGGGIYLSLLGGQLCARTAVEALSADDVSGGRLRAYQRAWSKRMGAELRRGHDLRRIFVSLSDDDFDRLTRMLRSDRLQRIIARHGDIDFPSKMFARLFFAAPLIGRFIRVRLALRHWIGNLRRAAP